jgi:hypothetical protein
MNTSGVSMLARQDETAQNPFALSRVDAAGEAAEVAEEALGQVGGPQVVTPGRGPVRS